MGPTQLPPFFSCLYPEKKSLFVSNYSNQVSLKWGNTKPVRSSSLLVICNLAVQKKSWLAETFYHVLSGRWSHSGCGTRRKCHHRASYAGGWPSSPSRTPAPALVVSPGPDLEEADSLWLIISRSGLGTVACLRSVGTGSTRGRKPVVLPKYSPRESELGASSLTAISLFFPSVFSLLVRFWFGSIRFLSLIAFTWMKPPRFLHHWYQCQSGWGTGTQRSRQEKPHHQGSSEVTDRESISVSLQLMSRWYKTSEITCVVPESLKLSGGGVWWHWHQSLEEMWYQRPCVVLTVP